MLNRFIEPFLQNKKHTRLPGAVYAAVMLVLYVFPWDSGYRIVNLFGTASFFAAMYVVDKRNAGQKAFLAVTGYLLKWITGGFESVLWSMLSGRFLLSPYLTDKAVLSLIVFVVLEIVSCIAGFGIQILFCSIISRAYVCNKEDSLLNTSPSPRDAHE